MLIVKYDPSEGTIKSDDHIESWVETLCAENVIGECLKIVVGGFMAIEMFRLAVVRGWIRPDELSFEYEVDDSIIRISINSKGSLDQWPRGFGDMHGDMISELIGLKLK